jgi:hypothetical protein
MGANRTTAILSIKFNSRAGISISFRYSTKRISKMHIDESVFVIDSLCSSENTMSSVCRSHYYSTYFGKRLAVIAI